MEQAIEVRILKSGEEHVLEHVAEDVFDEPVQLDYAKAFLQNSSHHLAVALDQRMVIGFASGVTYMHPDKPLELWINEVGVAATHQGQGIGKRVINALLERGRALGCDQAWVLTSHDNLRARRLYESVGARQSVEETVMYSFALEQSRQHSL